MFVIYILSEIVVVFDELFVLCKNEKGMGKKCVM